MGNLRRLFYSSLFSGIVSGALSVIIPVYLNTGFHTTLTTMGFVFSAYGLFFALLQIPASFLGDRLNKKSMLLASGILEGVTVLVYAAGTKLWHFAAGKGLEGVSMSLSRSPSNAMLTEISEHHRFSESFGNLIGYFSIGYFAGYCMAGPLAGLLGYQGAILSLLAFQAVSVAMLMRIKHVETSRKIKFNLKKFLQRPHRSLKILALAGMFISIVETMDYTVTVIYLKDVHGASLTIIGLFMGAGWLSYGLAQVISGRISDRVGRRLLYLAGGIIAGTCILLLPKMPSLASAALFFMLLSAGHGIALPAVRGITADATSPKYRSQDFGLVTTLEELGTFIGFPLMGYLADNTGFDAAFQLRGLMVLGVTIAVYLFINENKKHEQKT